MKKLKWLYQNIEEILLCIFLTILVCVSGIQVAARYIFNNSLTWSEELCRYLYVWSGFTTVGFAIKHGSIIKIDTLVTALPKSVRRILDVVTSLITIFIVAVLFRGGVSVVAEVVRTGQLTPAMRVPIWLVYLCAPVGYALIELRMVEHLIGVLRGKKDEAAAKSPLSADREKTEGDKS